MSTTATIDPRIEERAAAKAEALEAERLAQLRAEAEREIEEEEAEVEREREIAQFIADLPGRFTGAEIEKVEQAMVKAIERYVAAVHQRDLAFSEAGSFVRDYDFGSATPVALTVAGQTYRGVDVQRGVSDAFAAAMAHYYPRTLFRLDVRH